MNMNFDFSNSSWIEYSKNLKKHNSSWIDSNQMHSGALREPHIIYFWELQLRKSREIFKHYIIGELQKLESTDLSFKI